MDNLSQYQQRFSINDMFSNGFLCGKSLYFYQFGTIPNLNSIGQVDSEKAFEMLLTQFPHLVQSVRRRRWYDKQKKAYDFDETFVIANNRCILEFDGDYCGIYHDGTEDAFVQAFTEKVSVFKQRQRRKPLEINLITHGNNGLQLTGLQIKRIKLDLGLYYEDDFAAVAQVIHKRLNNAKDKGIVLLHGLPGTGKTTYLRYLIGKIKKKVLFLSPGVAKEITSPIFIQLLVNNPNSLMVIEDAENIIMDRRFNNGSGVSGLLNIADGLMADFLNVQIICTFNSPLTMVDTALMRQGRLIAKYEFGKLGIAKAQKLSEHFGYDTVITEPMTIAELANQHEAKYQPQQVEVMGFRRQEPALN
jgi:ATPase family associated with various cellular activities (AAA)